MASLNFQVGDYSPVRAAIECGDIPKIKLVLQQAGYRDFDIVNGLNPEIPLADAPLLVF
jgi:hypothetical protein